MHSFQFSICSGTFDWLICWPVFLTRGFDLNSLENNIGECHFSWLKRGHCNTHVLAASLFALLERCPFTLLTAHLVLYELRTKSVIRWPFLRSIAVINFLLALMNLMQEKKLFPSQSFFVSCRPTMMKISSVIDLFSWFLTNGYCGTTMTKEYYTRLPEFSNESPINQRYEKKTYRTTQLLRAFLDVKSSRCWQNWSNRGRNGQVLREM